MLLDILRRFAGATANAVETPLEHFIELETADFPYDGIAFASTDRALMSVLRVRGTRDLKSEEDRRSDVATLVTELLPVMAEPGQVVEIHYVRDPDRGDSALADQLQGPRAAASSIGLDMRALHDAQEQFLAQRASLETCHLALWTTPRVLPKVERDEAINAALQAKAKWPFRRARDGQDPFRGIGALRNRHEGFVSSWKAALGGCGIEVDVLDVKAAGRDVFEDLWIGEKAGGWSPVLPGDPAPLMVPDDFDDDPSAIIWPKVSRQLASAAWSVDREDWEIARFGSRLVASVDVVIGPQAAQDFALLRDRLARAGGGGVPFRMSVKIRSGGDKQNSLAASLAPFAALFGGLNRKLMESLQHVREKATSEGCVTWQMAFSTWISVDDPEAHKKLRSRMAELRRCVEQWGGMQTRTMTGDPIQGALSSVLGISKSSTAIQGYAPLADVLTMLPRRAASPWDRGALPCLTPDGAIYPIEEGSDRVHYSFEAIVATMGSGKSAMLARKVFGNILAKGASTLPYVVFLDVGYGSAGIIETLKEAAPLHLRMQVAHEKMRMDADHAINILTSPLGRRMPPPDHLAMIQEAVIVLITPAESNDAVIGLGSLVQRLIVEAFQYRDDSNGNGEPRLYETGVDRQVDAAIHRTGISTHVTSSGRPVPWWWIVDRLFDAGAIDDALRAQRYAVPIMSDLERVLSNPSVRKDFEMYSEGALLNMAATGLKSALSQYPICDGPTRFEPTARVVALDLQDVLGKGDNAEARKRKAVVYTWCLVAFTKTWWTEPRDVAKDPMIAQRYKAWHLRMAEDIAQTPKVLVADEFHETGGSPGTQEAIKKMVRKGRKYRIRVYVATQMLHDLDKDFLQLLSSVTVLSAGNRQVVDQLVKFFGLTKAHEEALGKLGRRDPKLGQPFFSIVNSVSGRFSQLLYSAMSGMELWAVTTNPIEVELRHKLAQRVTFMRAVALLSTYEPFRRHGAEVEIDLRVQQALERSDYAGAEKSKIIDDIVGELAALSRGRVGHLSERVA